MPLLRTVYFIPCLKNKSSPPTSLSVNVNDIATIGGSGGSGRNRSKHSPLERLDGSVLSDEDVQHPYEAELAINMYRTGSGSKRVGDEESQKSGDAIPLKGIQICTEVEKSGERR